MKRFFLTGATGFLGREVLVRLLRLHHPVLVITRRRKGESTSAAEVRLAAIVQDTDPGCPTTSLTVAFGDVTEPQLGLDAEARAWLDHGPVQIVHGAAEVRFDLPYAYMHKQNVEGTMAVLELARALGDGLVRMDHVSTTYIAGDRIDVVDEQDVDVGQSPRNSYERTKLLSEVEVAKARDAGLPITVHRPSIIVGDSRTGRASSFKVLYWPMKIYARGKFRTVIGRPDCVVDVVPVDYVADAMVHLFEEPKAVGGVFHLAAGPERQSTIGALVSIGENLFERKRVRYFNPDIYLKWLRPIVKPILMLIKPDVGRRGGVFLPYLRSNPTFSVKEASKLLAPAGIEPPDVHDYFERIIRFARDTDFGRLTLDRPTDTKE